MNFKYYSSLHVSYYESFLHAQRIQLESLTITQISTPKLIFPNWNEHFLVAGSEKYRLITCSCFSLLYDAYYNANMIIMSSKWLQNLTGKYFEVSCSMLIQLPRCTTIKFYFFIHPRNWQIERFWNNLLWRTYRYKEPEVTGNEKSQENQEIIQE